MMACISPPSRPPEAEELLGVEDGVEFGPEVKLDVSYVALRVEEVDDWGGSEAEVSGPFIVLVAVTSGAGVVGKNDEAYSSRLEEAYERMFEQMAS